MTRWPHHPDTLSRGDLESNRMRDLYAANVDPALAFSDVQLSESLTATLNAKPKGAGWWVFAYGSLLWNPLFPFSESRRVRARGFHRRFCLWSLASRGRPDAPGLVLGLDRGGSCPGVAYRLPAPLAIDELHLLWRREMVTGAYDPKWIKLDADGKPLVALAFVIKRDHPQYAGQLPLDEQSRVIATACGAFGSSADYLERTRIALVTHGVVDPTLETLAKAVAQRCAPGTPATSLAPGEPPL